MTTPSTVTTPPTVTMPAPIRGGPTRDWSAAARFYEYSKAANPPLHAVPYDVFGAERHASGPSAVIPWDLSATIGSAWPATSPGLLASFIRIRAGEQLRTDPVASSQVFYVIRGAGSSRVGDEDLVWKEGDLFTPSLPQAASHRAVADTSLYWVSDAPLLAYLGAAPQRSRFTPTLYSRERLLAEVERVRAEPGAQRRNRLGVILGNLDTSQTMTVTHTMWSLLNVLPAGALQKPHRHNSVALDLALSAKPGTYTLMSRSLDGEGRLVEPIRAEWAAGSAFVTPPGWWHSHHNESDADAYVLPIQDAGLHTWMRTLDIQFTA